MADVLVFLEAEYKMTKRIVRKEILSLKPYKAQERDFPVVLDANESPFPLPSVIKKEISKNIDAIAFNRYPDPEGKLLKKSLSEFHSVKPENIVLGNGSDELILYLISAFARKGYGVLYPVPTFSMYGIISQCLGQKQIEISLNADFDIDSDAFLQILKKRKVSVIFLSYPNNPTGNCFSKEKITKLLKFFEGIVVLDEAYGDFSGKTFLPLLNKRRNLVISKTFSKIGLSSLRLGYLVANQHIAEIVGKVRLPFNVNSFSQGCGNIFLKHRKSIDKLINEIVEGRIYLYSELKKIRGISPFQSEANFVLFRAQGKCGLIHEELKKKGILIRNLNQKGLLQDCLRVTAGTSSENLRFVKAINSIIPDIQE